MYIISNKRTEKRIINRKLRAESKWARVFFSQRKRKPTPVVINDEDNQIQDGMNNNTKKKNKKGNFALMPLQYLLARLINPNSHKKGKKKNYYNINFIYP